MIAIFARIGAVLRALRIRQLLAALLVGAILLTTNIADASLSSETQANLDRVTEQGETGRPRTTGQWEAERDSLQGKPIKRLERITEETADAVGEMAEIYPQNAKTLTPGVGNGELPEDD